MFVVDGIAYAGEPQKGIAVESAKVVNDLCMVVTFSNGESRVFDAAPLLDLEAFKPLADPNVFKHFSVDSGVLTWLNGQIDISSEKLYEMSYRYEKTA